VFWGTGIDPLPEAVAISGSSMTTLGFERPDGLGPELLAVGEAALGLGLVALLISYLPSIYTAFQRRERVVGGLQTRMGLPPSPVKMYRRYVSTRAPISSCAPATSACGGSPTRSASATTPTRRPTTRSP
jgi:hypothetical protein